MATLRIQLFNSVYSWILDQDYTPYILVDAAQEAVAVPPEHIQDGRIILNIHPRSVDNFYVDDDGLSFSARFNGTSRQIMVPATALMALYTRETNQGVVFQGDSIATELMTDAPDEPESEKKSRRPQLTLVK